MHVALDLGYFLRGGMGTGNLGTLPVCDFSFLGLEKRVFSRVVGRPTASSGSGFAVNWGQS